jgi:hypothetical protein
MSTELPKRFVNGLREAPKMRDEFRTRAATARNGLGDLSSGGKI